MRSSLLSLSALAVGAMGASLQQVTNFGSNPTSIEMYTYIPNQLASNPPIVVAIHYCGGSAQAMFGYTQLPSYADKYGFVLIYPQTTHAENCWDVYSPASLTRGGGGDSQGIVNMVDYALKTWNGDPTRVYVMGSSSGAMMTNVLAATYPDVFEAGAAFSGVPACCFAGSGASYPGQSNETCPSAQVIHSGPEWGNFARNCDLGYSGTRTRMQLWHGTADGVVFYPLLGEEIKQWSNVLGVSFNYNVTQYPTSYYTEMVFGDGTKMQAYSGVGVGHPAPVQEQPMLSFFGVLASTTAHTTTTATSSTMTTVHTTTSSTMTTVHTTTSSTMTSVHTTTTATSSTMTTTSPTTTITSAPSITTAVGGIQSLWGQCGGSGYAGPTICAAGAACSTQNPWYAQCLSA